jgi:hypothetical protein
MRPAERDEVAGIMPGLLNAPDDGRTIESHAKPEEKSQ